MENQMPGVVDVQAKVLKLGKHICTSVLYIGGVPRTDEKQIHLGRFPNDHPLVHLLKKADTVCVTKRNPPDDERLELKKCGVHLIFEGDDVYEGDEESLDKAYNLFQKGWPGFLTLVMKVLMPLRVKMISVNMNWSRKKK
jgi:hypothetical protein